MKSSLNNNLVSGLYKLLHSTIAALLEATDSWAFNIDRGYLNVLVSLDLKKAFESFDREILPAKMNRCGVQGKTLDWFKSYLTNRTQQCSTVVSLTSPLLYVVCHRERSLALFYF